MSGLVKLWWALLLGLQMLVRGSWQLLTAILGRPGWQAPLWPGALARAALANPGRSLALVVGAAALTGAGWWYVHRPKPPEPVRITLEVNAPELTNYREAPIVVSPLRVEFSASVAPLAQVDKPALGVTMSPELAGSWRWEGDRTLVFQPAADWPAGTHYEVEFDPELTVSKQVLLETHEFEFDTAPFGVTIASAEFYQDPQQAALKKGIVSLSFTHPVDPATLETRVQLALVDGGGTSLPTPGHTFSYDERKLNAFVHSAPLELPSNGGRLRFKLESPVRSSVPGPGFESRLETSIDLPALYSLTVNEINATLVDNARFEPEQVLVLGFSAAVMDSDVTQLTRAWVLPNEHPEHPGQSWSWSLSEVTDAILAQAQPLPLEAIAAEREYIETHSFKFAAAQGAQVFVSVDKGLKSFGGYLLGKRTGEVVRVPDYPQLLRFVADGALLSLRGERKLTVVSRNVPGLKMEVARILPEQLQHLVRYNQGSFGKPELYSVDFDGLSERFELPLPLPGGEPGRSRYEGLDLGTYLQPGKRGIFVLSLKNFDPADPEAYQEQTDQRLVVLTDLGLVVKKQKDGTRVVFVASLVDGSAVAGAMVSVIGINGEQVVSVPTDATGRADLPQLDAFEREKKPVLIAARMGDDLSFLPLDNVWAHQLDLSRFEIGGDVNPESAGTLDAHLFSDRGLYRPGDTMHIGLIVRAADWKTSLSGLPVRAEIVDPQGTVVLDQPVALGPIGFEEIEYSTRYSSPTGTYAVSLYLKDEHQNRTELGATTVRVREFLPDRLKVKATLSAQAAQGWVKPEGLAATVNVVNLFGTAAQQRRVEASLDLQPFWPRFAAFPEHQFFDPRRAEEGFSEELTAGETDDAGVARFELPLSNYADSTYQLRFSAQAYEAAGGRSVSAETATLVSANDYLLGIKINESLDYVQRGARRTAEVIAVDPQVQPIAVEGLKTVLIEQRYVSLLTKQSSGVYKYESQLRENTLSESPLVLNTETRGTALELATDQPGSFRIEFRDATGKVLNQLSYNVAGAANLTRSLERNAELKLSLSKGEYAPGETLEVAIRAPYVGSGLITIERDRIYAHRWFKTDTTASVQTITVPEGLEGGAYINVQFVRDPDSDEVFMSPLSYGVAPFSINRLGRTAPLALKVPEKIKPGEKLQIEVSSANPVRAAVFAVDMGILQVARYQLADPLDHFLRKRMLEVDTAQILDLILPEFSKLAALSAPGGDDDSGMGRNLNPFKRKRDKPAVIWFGIRDINESETFDWTVPDTFNGALKIMVVAVGSERIGIAEKQTLVRGDFVLSPNVPTTIAPGDAFEVSLGVADNREDGATGPVEVSLQAPASLSVEGPAVQSLDLKPGSEGVVIWKLRTGQELGTPELKFEVKAGRYSARQGAGLSLRPAMPRQTVLTTGRSDGQSLVLDGNRPMWNEFSKREVAAARVPAVLLDGLTAYLDNFPHKCTEQLVSQGLPGLIFAQHPGLGRIEGSSSGVDAHAATVEVLRSRQNSEGAFGLWTASVDSSPFVSVYATLYLVEARERGLAVPPELLNLANSYLQQVAANESFQSLDEVRARAFAVYLLTRQGQVTTNALLSTRQQLEAGWPQAWRSDASALLLAASYAGLKQEDSALPLLDETLKRLSGKAELADWQYAQYYDPLIADALAIYLLEKHFPQQARKLPASMAERLVEPIAKGYYNTLSSALSILALEAYATGNPDAKPVRLYGLDKDQKATELEASGGLVQRALYGPEALKLKLETEGKPPFWYVRSETGFDLKLPEQPSSAGVEIQREYLDADGNATTKLTLGQEATVRLRLRSADRRDYYDLAIIDLLPGGFEIVEPEPDADGNLPPLVETTTSFQHLDAREDRMLIYASASDTLGEFRYRIKATAAGRFVQPPAYVESMYERSVRSNGAGGAVIEVVRP